MSGETKGTSTAAGQPEGPAQGPAGRPAQGNGLKICRKCWLPKSLEDDFYPHKNTADGKENYCKACRLKQRRIDDQKNPEATRLRHSRARKQPHQREQRREYKRLWVARRKAQGTRMDILGTRPRTLPGETGAE